MRAVGLHAAELHDVDLIGGDHRAEAMGDDEAGAVLAQGVEGLLDEVLALRVHGGGGFVEQEDGRVFQEGAGHGEALPFAPAESHAALADFGIQAFLLPFHEVFGAGELEGLPQLVVGGVGLAEEEVVPHGAGEEEGVLRDVADALPQAVAAVFGDGHVVDADAAALRIVEAR